MNGIDRSIASSKNQMEAEPNFNGLPELLNGLEVGGDDANAVIDHLRALMGGDLDAARRWLRKSSPMELPTQDPSIGCSTEA